MNKKIHYVFFAIGIFMSLTTTVQAEDNKAAQVMTQGLSHLGLTVSKLDQTADFFVNTLGWNLAAEKPAYPAKICHRWQYVHYTLAGIKHRISH